MAHPSPPSASRLCITCTARVVAESVPVGILRTISRLTAYRASSAQALRNLHSGRRGDLVTLPLGGFPRWIDLGYAQPQQPTVSRRPSSPLTLLWRHGIRVARPELESGCQTSGPRPALMPTPPGEPRLLPPRQCPCCPPIDHFILENAVSASTISWDSGWRRLRAMLWGELLVRCCDTRHKAI